MTEFEGENVISKEMTIEIADELLEKIGEQAAIIKKYEDERDVLINRYQQKISSAKDICERNCFQARETIEYYSEQLKDFAAANLPKGKKTVELPSGKLSFKKQTRYICNGEAVGAKTQPLIDFAKRSAPQFLVSTVSWGELKNQLANDGENVYYKETGELIDGIKFEQLPDSFTVKPK